MKHTKSLAVASLVATAVSLGTAGTAVAQDTAVAPSKASGHAPAPAADGYIDCHIPEAGWVDCTTVKLLADDTLDVVNYASHGQRVDCNLNDPGTGAQLNRYTAYMHEGQRHNLWHNNTSGTVYAQLRCASPYINDLPVTLEVIRW